jgi:electron transfer flavoprotein beta subunit
MKILVCVKQVPDLEQITVDQNEDGTAVLNASPSLRMNRFDEYAVEQAVRIKEAHPAVRVDALSVGPEDALQVVKRAMGMGADRGVLLRSTPGAGPPPATVAARIAAYASARDYALILTGSMSEDGMHGQTGPMIAAHLGRPCAPRVMDMQLVEDRPAVMAEREIEGGMRQALELALPAVLSLQTGINQPRYPSLSNLLRANRQAAEVVDAAAWGQEVKAADLMGLVRPPQIRAGEVLAGTARAKAERLVAILREKRLVG